MWDPKCLCRWIGRLLEPLTLLAVVEYVRVMRDVFADVGIGSLGFVCRLADSSPGSGADFGRSFGDPVRC